MLYERQYFNFGRKNLGIDIFISSNSYANLNKSALSLDFFIISIRYSLKQVLEMIFVQIKNEYIVNKTYVFRQNIDRKDKAP